MKPRFNIEATEELSVGMSAVHDSEKFKNIWTQAIYKPIDCKKSFCWLRADLVANLVSAGFNQAHCDNITQSFEATYGWKDFKGIQGHPVVIRGGVEYELSDQTCLTASGQIGENYNLTQEVEHKIDSHWTVSAQQSFESPKVGSKQSPYHIGFAAAYKL